MTFRKFLTFLAIAPIVIEILFTTGYIMATTLLFKYINLDVNDPVERTMVLVAIAVWAIQFVAFLIFLGIIPKNKPSMEYSS